jgi:hypothetical protein
MLEQETYWLTKYRALEITVNMGGILLDTLRSTVLSESNKGKSVKMLPNAD